MKNKKGQESVSEVLEDITKIIGLILIGLIIFEIGFLIYAYFYADKLECNLLWCTATFNGDELEIHNKEVNITSTSECFINGEQVNCSEIEKYETTN